MPRSRQHAAPADLLALRQRILQGRIEAPFVACPIPNCENGWIRHFDFENCSTWLTECQKCKGLGRIYLQTEPAFVTRLRALWKRIRDWTPPRWFRLTVGTLGCLLLIAVLGACLWLWMAL